jgi:hypothetical protein
VIRPAHQQPLVTLARRSVAFVVVFFLGWFFAVVLCIYELFFGPAIEQLDILLGTFGSAHSVAVPFIYGFLNKAIRNIVYRMLTCKGEKDKIYTIASTGSIDSGPQKILSMAVDTPGGTVQPPVISV